MSGPSSAGGQGAVDSNGAIAIDGGEIFVAGSMLVTPTGAQQWVAATASGSAGDTVEVTDAAGTVIATFEADQSFGAVFYSGPAVTDGASYAIAVNGVSAATVTEGVNVAGGMGGARRRGRTPAVIPRSGSPLGVVTRRRPNVGTPSECGALGA